MTDPLGVGTPPPSWPPVRHPFQVSSFGAFTAIGAGWLLSQPTPPVNFLLPLWMLVIWNVILVISGALGLLSAIIARRVESVSLLAERTALIGVGGYCAIDVVAVVDLRGWATAWSTAIVFGCIAAGCVWRGWQVEQRVKWLKRRP